MQNHSRICHFSVSIRLSSHTNGIGHCGWRKSDDDHVGRQERCLTILCNHREFCQRISVSIIFYNFAFARTFICFPALAPKKQKTMAHDERCPPHAYHTAPAHKPNTMAKLLDCRIIIRWNIYYEIHAK